MAQRQMPTLFSAELGQHPFLQSLHREIDRVFDRFRDEDDPSEDGLFAIGRRRVMPALDISESDDSVEVTAELPGVSAEDLDVSITDGVLVLQGEKRIDREETDKDFQLVERRYGRFRRSVPLGFAPEDGKVDADFTDGVLKLRIEKPATAAKKTQKVQIGSS